MRAQEKSPTEQAGSPGLDNATHNHHTTPTDAVNAARQRLRDAIIAVGLPYHHGVALFAAADAYAKAMRHEVHQ